MGAIVVLLISVVITSWIGWLVVHDDGDANGEDGE